MARECISAFPQCIGIWSFAIVRYWDKAALYCSTLFTSTTVVIFSCQSGSFNQLNEVDSIAWSIHTMASSVVLSSSQPASSFQKSRRFAARTKSLSTASTSQHFLEAMAMRELSTTRGKRTLSANVLAKDSRRPRTRAWPPI